jgi:hypothetical protein
MRRAPQLLLFPFAFAALPLLGCATGNGAFRADGFHHDDYPYTVHYADRAGRQILPNWRIDNYVVDDEGKPGQAKTTTDYEGEQKIDLNGDGDPEKPTVYYYDLRLLNRRNSGVIWLQTVPLPADHAERDLAVMVRDYATALAGTGFYATFANDKAEVRAKTYATKIVASKPGKMGPFDSYDATIELANVDQLKLDPAQRSAILRVVFVRTDYVREWTMPTEAKTAVVLRAGYWATPEDFAAGLPDFERFLGLLDLQHAKE